MDGCSCVELTIWWLSNTLHKSCLHSCTSCIIHVPCSPAIHLRLSSAVSQSMSVYVSLASIVVPLSVACVHGEPSEAATVEVIWGWHRQPTQMPLLSVFYCLSADLSKLGRRRHCGTRGWLWWAQIDEGKIDIWNPSWLFDIVNFTAWSSLEIQTSIEFNSPSFPPRVAVSDQLGHDHCWSCPLIHCQAWHHFHAHQPCMLSRL